MWPFIHSLNQQIFIRHPLGRRQPYPNDKLLLTPHLLSWPRVASGTVNALEDHSSGRPAGPALNLLGRSSSSLRSVCLGGKGTLGVPRAPQSQCALFSLPPSVGSDHGWQSLAHQPLDQRSNCAKTTRMAAQAQHPVLCPLVSLG